MQEGRCLVAGTLGFVLLLAGVGDSPAQTNQLLFVVARSKNANILHYDAQLDQDGKLNAREPVKVYWILLADKGQVEELNLVERKKAYGFDIQPEASVQAHRMTLRACPTRAIKVYQTSTGVKAELIIDGRPAYFEKMYIDSTEGLVLPTVNYIELFGRDVTTGAKRYEKMVP